MCETADAVVSRYADAEFHHRAELLALLRSGVEMECGPAVPAPVLARTYQVRRTNLERMARDRDERLDPALAVVLADLRVLVPALEQAGDAQVRWWSVRQPGGTVHLVAEAVEDQRILGCVKARDQRIRPYRNDA